MQVEPYDPSWLVDLARSEGVDEEIVELVTDCTQCYKESDAYIWFVPEEEREKCQHASSVELHHPQKGVIVVDTATMANQVQVVNMIVGIEFVDSIR